MNNQEWLAHETGELSEPEASEERDMQGGDGRYDNHIETYLHHIKDLRELRQVPLSAGDEGNTPAGTAGKSGDDAVAVRPSLMAGKDVA